MLAGGALRRAVHSESRDRRPTDRRLPLDGARSHDEVEMFEPGVLPRVVQTNDGPRARIYGLEMRTFPHITGSASQRLVFRRAAPAWTRGMMYSTSKGKLKTASGARQYSQRCPARNATAS